MEPVLEILKYVLPSLIVFATTVYLVKKYFDGEEKKRQQQTVLNNQNMITPLRLQAYERAILFLERISPENLIMRVNKPGLTCQQLQSELLHTIRSEFEHNLSQQIYMSPQAWEVVRNARSNTIKLINSEFEKMPENASGMDFSRQLLSAVMELEKEPTRVALDFVKAEVARML